MTKLQFKQFYSRLRKIRNAPLVGTHGHYSDLVKEFGVPMQLIRDINDMKSYHKAFRNRIVYGKYTKAYQNRLEQQDAWDSYYERIVGA